MKIDLNVIYRLVGDGMMGVAMRMLRKSLDEVTYELQNRFENVEMLLSQYYKYEDKSMTRKVIGSVLELADDMNEAIAEKSAVRYEYSIRRNWHINNDTLMVALSSEYDFSKGVTVELDAQLIVLFRQVWLSGRLDQNSISLLNNFVNGDCDVFARKMVVMAMMLRCIRHYDLRLVEILMNCSLAESYVALVMIAMACQKRIDADPLSLDAFRAFLSDTENEEKCAMVYGNVMRTFETQNIASEMRDKIFPFVREQGQQFGEKSKSVQLFDENGLNPEWEERLEDSGVMGRMRRINDLQLDGADIHYESFKMMKSSAFFMDTAHWFYPFDIKYHLLHGTVGDEESYLGNVSQLLNLCDLDRYSLFLMLQGIGVKGLKGALANLGLNNYDELREQLGSDEKWKETFKISFATEIKFAVMNLFRFYNLAPNHSDMISPFARIMPAERSQLGYCIVPPMIRYQAALLLFKARQWESAHDYFVSVVDTYIAEDAMIYQKMGYCSEKMQKWQNAVDDYEKSDVIVPDDVWTLRHTAYCHRQLGDDELAAVIYRKVLELDKESIVAIDNLADIYLSSGEFTHAKPLLFEMEYRRGNMTDYRRLGFCLFMMGEREEALKCFDKMCGSNEASSEEFMMRAICSGNEAHLAETCAIIYEPSGIVDALNSGDVCRMMECLDVDGQEKIKSTINKIILEQ